MKGLRVLTLWWGLIAAGCALPLGEDYLITRDGSTDVIYITDYNLLNYVPIPKPGDVPVTLVDNRGDWDLAVAWKDENGVPAPQPFTAFAANTVYRAEITIRPKTPYGFYPATLFAYEPAGKVESQQDDLGDPTRTITVTYNNSDDWNVTYITDYNLQNYVPVPLAGEKPVRAVDSRADLAAAVKWQVEKARAPGEFEDIPSGADYTFQLRALYRAEITLTALTPDYRFFPKRNFFYPDGTPADPVGDETDPALRRFTAAYRITRTPTVISDLNLTPYVPKPQSGTTALTSFAASQYTGTVAWKNTETGVDLSGSFQPNTAYTAVLTLSPASGYTVNGLGGNAFAHSGAETISSPPDSGTVTMTFQPTGNYGSPIVVYDTILTGRLPMPVTGMTPVMGITGAEYFGSVSWVPFHSAFQAGTAYKAMLTLTAMPGHTFNGIEENVFSHGEAAAVTNSANSGTVTITFPPTASSTYKTITSFGPVETETSALWLMKALKDDTYPLAIDLPDEESEEVEADSVTLVAGLNSPATVIINGHHRTLRIKSPGTLLTVGAGVTLSLQNITLKGTTQNSDPLVAVVDGGTLLLETGAVLTGNESSGAAGGVLVDGGTLILNEGAAVEKMAAGAVSDAAGGVGIRGTGSFIMNGGIIAGNQAAGTNSGGGVWVYQEGSFTMYGGTIKGNAAAGSNSGGGVYNDGGFTMHGGTIGGDEPADANRADASGGGGVYAGPGNGSGKSFTMAGGVIKGNTDYGVYVAAGTFPMSGSAQVHINNQVFLADTGFYITIARDLTAETAASVIRAVMSDGDPVIGARTEDLIRNNKRRFLYNGQEGEDHIEMETPPFSGDVVLGKYK
jgi:hypothetical protein